MTWPRGKLLPHHLHTKLSPKKTATLEPWAEASLQGYWCSHTGGSSTFRWPSGGNWPARISAGKGKPHHRVAEPLNLLCCGYTGDVSSRSCGTKQVLTRPEEEPLLEREDSSADVAPHTAGENDICTTISVLTFGSELPSVFRLLETGRDDQAERQSRHLDLQPETGTW